MMKLLSFCSKKQPVEEVEGNHLLGKEQEKLVVKEKVLEQKSIEVDYEERRILKTSSPEGYDLVLWGDLKTMIEPNEEDEIWRNQQD
ncbi:hypothetical protein Tco_1269162 [Tanacetum coccineum]